MGMIGVDGNPHSPSPPQPPPPPPWLLFWVLDEKGEGRIWPILVQRETQTLAE